MSVWLDLSYSRIDAAWAARRKAEGYQGLIQCAVALPFGGPDPIEHAGENLRAAREGGLATMVYIVYGDVDAVLWTTQQALRICGAEWDAAAFAWADFETNASEPIGLVEAAIQAIQNRRLPCGIYTNLDWWSRHMGATDNFAGTPLWQALWDNNPDWRAVYQLDGLATVGKQFGGGQIEGVDVDISSFSDEWIQSLQGGTDMTPEESARLQRIEEAVQRLETAVSGDFQYGPDGPTNWGNVFRLLWDLHSGQRRTLAIVTALATIAGAALGIERIVT
ncbi:MAG TPA: hypothetical protein VNL15_06045 [Dehalococcoidia bacterium]|nr:hypothetical protein [Dehalococcoidia bacterium]